MRDYLWVGLGGALGSMARHWMADLVITRLHARPHIGILVVNLSGCLIIGFLASLLDTKGAAADHPLRHLVLIGVLGGYTTFSSFSLQTLHLIRQAEWLAAGWNVFASLSGCLLAVAIGFYLGTLLRTS